MALSLEPYRPELAGPIRAFNARLAAARIPHGFRMGVPDHDYAPPPDDLPVRKTSHAVLEDGEVRGGVMTQHHRAVLAGREVDAVNIQLPIAEGRIDPKFGYVGMWLLKTVVRRHPYAFAVGMGGADEPLPKLLAALGWTVRAVPFLFRVHRATPFLREMPLLRRGGLRTLAADVAATSRVGAVALKLDALRHLPRHVRGPRLATRLDERWGDWADAVWAGARGGATFACVRDAEALRLLYPEGDRVRRCAFYHDGRPVGWSVLLQTQMRDSKYFGNLCVGTVLDCLALPGFEGAVARYADAALGDLGVDLALTNQAHAAWQRAFRDGGYRPGPSNYLLATSRPLTTTIGGAGPGAADRVHVTRGDGDGRIHL